MVDELIQQVGLADSIAVLEAAERAEAKRQLLAWLWGEEPYLGYAARLREICGVLGIGMNELREAEAAVPRWRAAIATLRQRQSTVTRNAARRLSEIAEMTAKVAGEPLDQHEGYLKAQNMIRRLETEKQDRQEAAAKLAAIESDRRIAFLFDGRPRSGDVAPSFDELVNRELDEAFAAIGEESDVVVDEELMV